MSSGKHHRSWGTIEELLALLRMERAALDLQISALEATGDPNDATGRMAMLLCRYLVDGSAAKAAEWANYMEWRLPSIRDPSSTRQYTQADIYAAIRGPDPDIAPGLVALCRRLLASNRG